MTRAELAETRVDVPRDLLAGGELKIALRIPTAASPAALGAGADQRTLGIALKSLEIAAK